MLTMADIDRACSLIEGHVRFHVLDPHRKPNADQSKAVEELINVVKTYLK